LKAKTTDQPSGQSQATKADAKLRLPGKIAVSLKLFNTYQPLNQINGAIQKVTQ